MPFHLSFKYLRAPLANLKIGQLGFSDTWHQALLDRGLLSLASDQLVQLTNNLSTVAHHARDLKAAPGT